MNKSIKDKRKEKSRKKKARKAKEAAGRSVIAWYNYQSIN